MAQKHCLHCTNMDPDGHDPACPVKLNTEQAMKDWRRGYDWGWKGNGVYDLPEHKNPTVQLGWIMGAADHIHGNKSLFKIF